MAFLAEQLWSDESSFALALLMDESGLGGCQDGPIFRNAIFCEGLGPLDPAKQLHFSWWTRCAAGAWVSAAPASQETTPGLYRVTSANTQAQQNRVHDSHRCDAQVSTGPFNDQCVIPSDNVRVKPNVTQKQFYRLCFCFHSSPAVGASSWNCMSPLLRRWCWCKL